MYEKKLAHCARVVTVETYLGIPFVTAKKTGQIITFGEGGRNLKILNRDAMKKPTLLII
jgi:hypothetical protein